MNHKSETAAADECEPVCTAEVAASLTTPEYRRGLLSLYSHSGNENKLCWICIGQACRTAYYTYLNKPDYWIPRDVQKQHLLWLAEAAIDCGFEHPWMKTLLETGDLPTGDA